MQGLWSTHRRNKLNLNSSTSSGRSVATTTVTDDQDLLKSSSALENLPATPSQSKQDPDANVNGKRKIRSSRTVEGSKRQKMALSGAFSKDNSPPIARLSDLGGIEPCIEKMLELVAMPLCHPEVYLHTGVQPPRGVLLHGPPGCGKTLLAHAMAGVSGQSLHGFTRIDCLPRNLVSLSLAFPLLLLYPVCQGNRKRRLEIRLTKQRYISLLDFDTANTRISVLHPVCYS